MFGSKKAQWAVQILTHDYLIDALIDEDKGKFDFSLEDLLRVNPTHLNVSSAQIQPTVNGAMTEVVSGPSAFVWGSSIVALIPRDEASTAYAMKKNAAYKYPFWAEAYVGPYVIRGNVQIPDKEFDDFGLHSRFVVQEATIGWRIPGAGMATLEAPYVVVVSKDNQLIRPLA